MNIYAEARILPIENAYTTISSTSGNTCNIILAPFKSLEAMHE